MIIAPQLGLNTVSGAQRFTSDDTATDPLVVPGTIATVKLGDRWTSFAYVRANATVAINQVLALGLNKVDADTDAAETTSSQNMTGTGDFTADDLGGQGVWLVINSGGGLKQGGHYVQRNSANILYTDRVWDEALTTSSDYLVHELNAVVLGDSDDVATKASCGVAISAITSGRWGWIQISGVHWRVRSVGSTDAAVVGEGVTPSSTGGACRGWTNAATTAEEVYFSFGVALCSDSEADAAAEGIPVLITNCKNYWN